MGLKLEDKRAVVAEVSAGNGACRGDDSVVENRGLEVGQMTELRKRARNAGCIARCENARAPRGRRYTVCRAGGEDGWSARIRHFERSRRGRKVLHEFAKGNEKFAIKGGAMGSYVMTSKEVASLATMPSREELLAKLLGTMQAPRSRAVRANAERGAVALRSRAGCRARCQGRGLTSVPRPLPFLTEQRNDLRKAEE